MFGLETQTPLLESSTSPELLMLKAVVQHRMNDIPDAQGTYEEVLARDARCPFGKPT